MFTKKTFKQQFSLADRFLETKRVLEKYCDRVPVICEKSYSQTDLPEIDKIKYLVPIDFTLGQFMYIIRQRLQLRSNEALFFLISNSIQSSSALIGQIYDFHKDDDGFLYIQYCKENVFG